MADLTEEFDISPEFCETYCYNKAWPLPRRSPPHVPSDDKYEVVISGAGPAGLFLTLLLARYGLNSTSVLCVDPKAHETDIGHADGIHARTVEIMATLGLEGDFLKYGREFNELAEWEQTEDGQLIRRMKAPFFFAPARFGQCYALNQGIFERILSQNLRKYSPSGVEYGPTVEEAKIDESNVEYPVVVKLRTGSETRTVRTKYLVGADGAHSVVRERFGIDMEGDIFNEIWGVIDFVPETDFPDIRRVTRYWKGSTKMTAMTVPRERLSNGHWLCRYYVDMTTGEERDEVVIVGDEMKEEVRRRKAGIKKDHILAQINNHIAPYKIAVKPGSKPVWWASYSVGQRLAGRFIVEDRSGHPRVFLAGDACHTHSPRQGQGLNISVVDAYYLAWRLAYSLMGIAIDPAKLLRTYEDERRAWAHKVVTADKRWNQGDLPGHLIMEEARQQVTGSGVEEKAGFLISEQNDAVDWQGTDLLSGVLRTGRRLFNIPVTRWTDGTPRALHEDFPSDGRYRILLLASDDFLIRARSQIAVEAICSLVPRYPGLVEQVVLLPETDSDFEWTDMPAELKHQAEMRMHIANQQAYDTLCVSTKRGALALVRPDGMVAVTANLEDVDEIREVLRRVLKESSNAVNGYV